jgi:nucleotide-binding universal stress UspA family protein
MPEPPLLMRCKGLRPLASCSYGKTASEEAARHSIFSTKILLATNGSEEAEMTAAIAINLAKNAHSELHVLTVGPGYRAYNVRIQEVAEELRRQAQDILDSQLKKVEQREGEGAPAHLRLAERHPGFEHRPSDDVVRIAEEIGAGLIVVGSRDWGGMRRALMGSISAAVVPQAHCPDMVVCPQEGHIAELQEQTACEKKYVRAGYRAGRGRRGPSAEEYEWVAHDHGLVR